MKPCVLAIALCACGDVASPPHQDAPVGPGDDASTVDARPPARTMRGHLDKTTPVMFGGGPKGFCTYTITLQPLDVTLEVQASGEVTAGLVTDTNIEAIVGTCTAGPIPPKAVSYTFASSKPTPDGAMLSFQAAAGNVPTVTLTGTLKTAAGATTVALSFKRSGTSDPVLDWLVTATLPLTVVTD